MSILMLHRFTRARSGTVEKAPATSRCSIVVSSCPAQGSQGVHPSMVGDLLPGMYENDKMQAYSSAGYRHFILHWFISG